MAHRDDDEAVLHPDLIATLPVLVPAAARGPRGWGCVGSWMIGRLGLIASEVRRLVVSPLLIARVTPGSRAAALTKRTAGRDGPAPTGSCVGRAQPVALRLI